MLPDPIPLLDEMILAVLTLAVGSWRVRDHDPFVKPPEKNVTPARLSRSEPRLKIRRRPLRRLRRDS